MMTILLVPPPQKIVMLRSATFAFLCNRAIFALGATLAHLLQHARGLLTKNNLALIIFYFGAKWNF